MLERAAEDVGNDLHVAMRMRSETHPGHDEIIIDDAQTAKTHPLRIVIIREAEGVIRVKPPVLGVAPFICFSNFHHDQTCLTTRPSGKDHVSCLSIGKRYARRRMELRHLRYFVAVAEAENVSRA